MSEIEGKCKRCGTCCMKGGPAFHRKDAELIMKGKISAHCIYTIRKGERARDDVIGRLIPVETDIIKIRGKGDSFECMFYDKIESSCGIYEDRPLECRALACWDTREIEAVYKKDRLTREALLSGVKGLWEVILDHQRRCDYDGIYSLVEIIRSETDSGRNEALAELDEIMGYDHHFRKLIVEKGLAPDEMMDFLFGGPLEKTLAPYSVFKK